MDKSQYENYLFDLGVLLKEKAIEAKQAKDALSNHEARGYELGRLMAYHEVISLMQQQAVAFDVSLNEIGLEDFDPDRRLL
jgi:hypothetical protein